MPLRNRPPQSGAKLFDFLIAELRLKNDAALGRTLHLTAPQVSKMRAGTHPVSGDTLLKIHDLTGLSIATLREHLLVPQEEAQAA